MRGSWRVGRIAAEPRRGVAAPAQQFRIAGDIVHLWEQRDSRNAQISLPGRNRVRLRRPAPFGFRRPPHEESVFGRQNRSVFQVGGKEGEVAGLGPQRHDGARHVVALRRVWLNPPPFRRARSRPARAESPRAGGACARDRSDLSDPTDRTDHHPACT